MTSTIFVNGVTLTDEDWFNDTNAIVYDTDSSYTGTLTGGTTSPTVTIAYIKRGNNVAIQMATNLTATSNAVTKTITGMPAAIRPARDVYGLVGCTDNSGTNAVGQFVIKTTGVIEVYPTPARGNWTGSGTATIDPISFGYTLL